MTALTIMRTYARHSATTPSALLFCLLGLLVFAGPLAVVRAAPQPSAQADTSTSKAASTSYTVNYSYDTQGRLKRAEYTTSDGVNYQYDAATNVSGVETVQVLSVHPGDTDDDGDVDQNDVLPIGTHYGLTGPSRTLGDGFVSAPVTAWSTQAATFADGNGSGKVEQNDLLPIGTHYGKSSSTTTVRSAGAAEPVATIHIRPVPAGTTVPLYLRAGTEEEPLRDALGTAAALQIPPGTFSVESVEATPALGEDLISFRNHDEESGRIGLAYTRRRPEGPAPLLADTAVVKVLLKPKGSMEKQAQIELADAKTTRTVGSSEDSSDVTTGPRLRLESPYAEQVPGEYALRQNYPNPATQRATIRFALPEAKPVTLEVYDMLGRRVATLKRKEKMQPGRHAVQVDASRLASGTYFYRLQAGDFQKTRKMVILR